MDKGGRVEEVEGESWEPKQEMRLVWCWRRRWVMPTSREGSTMLNVQRRAFFQGDRWLEYNAGYGRKALKSAEMLASEPYERWLRLLMANTWAYFQPPPPIPGALDCDLAGIMSRIWKRNQLALGLE